MAVENNRSESTKTLLSFNADVNIADNVSFHIIIFVQ